MPRQFVEGNDSLAIIRLTIMAANMAAVVGMAVLAAGTEEAVIRAALAGMALVPVGITLALLAWRWR